MGASSIAIGLIGLGVMGRNLALNLIDHGFQVAGYDQDAEARARSELGDIAVVESIPALLAHLPRPRSVLLMVPAGNAVDGVLDALCPVLQAGDTVIDGGNSHYRDTTRRAERLAAGGLHYLGLGISGGEAGARHGPAIMAGGAREAYDALEPLLQAVAAKVGDMPCVAYLGPDGAGHFVKTLHNGIEYADMQLIAEATHLLRQAGGLDCPGVAEIFRRWNEGALASYLLEISAEVLLAVDPATGKPLLDVIRDRAGEKGTGRWAAIAALELGVAAPSLAEAVFARALSMKSRRVEAIASTVEVATAADIDTLVGDLEGALLAAKICCYVQGFQVLAAASAEYEWHLPLADIARIWRGGCIIRARILEQISDALNHAPEVDAMLIDNALARSVEAGRGGLQRIVAAAQARHLSVPALSSALAYLDAVASPRLWADMIQAQRDYFGRHGFERVDQPGSFHHDWSPATNGIPKP